MTLTGPAGALPAEEQATILRIAATLGVQATFLAAIRLAENGGPGRQFGVLSEDATSYEQQATICARSIRNAMFRFVASESTWPITADDRLTDLFIHTMAKRWAPVGAENDPTALNANWVTNVTRAYRASGLAA